MKFEVVEQLWRNKEVLTRIFLTSNVDHAFVYHALVAWVHTLINLVNHAEGRARKTLECHEIENC